VRVYLNESFPNRWLGHIGPVAWPPRSPDLTPLDYYLWKHVYQQDTTLCSRCGAARFMNVRAAQRMRYDWSAWVTNVPSLLVFVSCPFYSYYDFCAYV